MRIIKWLAIAAGVLVSLVLVVPYLVPLPERQSPPDASPHANGRILGACGTRLHVRQWPSATAERGRVVLIHGFAGSTYSWRHTAPALAQAGFHVDAVDLPPYGYSGRAAPDQPVSRCLVEALQLEQGEGSLVVIGHSMGAAVAARIAQQLPAQRSHLVLVDGGVGGGNRRSSRALALLRFPPLARWTEVAAHHVMLRRPRFAEVLESAYGRPPDTEEVDAYRAPLLLAGTAPAVLSNRLPDLPLELDRLPPSILIVWGEYDTWVPTRVGERTRQQLPQAQWAVIPDAAHNPMETHPGQFNEVLLAFLGSSTSPGNGARGPDSREAPPDAP